MRKLSTLIKELARRQGFDACGIARVASADTEAACFDRWLAEGCHSGMKYMENHRDIRFNPEGLVEGARSVISVALNYYPEKKLPADIPHIAYYAYGKDYHQVVKEKLRRLWESILSSLQEDGMTLEEASSARIFTDSAPILERYWAWKAGIGFIGKNTNLIIPRKGSFFFLGEIVTTLEVDEYDEPQKNRCGNCTRCLKACPTGALEGEQRLNASRCLSYLTIEHKGEIPAEQAGKLGNRLYGCDTCQLVCPWNRFAVPTKEDEFRPSEALLSLKKEQLRMLTKEEYNRIFAHSAVKRAKYEGLLRTIRNLKE
ncbi:tRNA epoxyqueuosine(34) reductase QueG [Parabacteroides bouchesdurhonensis]|uniref:tRNA epoxyqueuosine(34) reductase QueG n=1 Tax=Parabacteroides bouchesdurhonensis TaxID=1936995 RepID=UPI000E4F3FF4|nr:tRNA epoxyqueuosine(34) reductase QueG [Parabacteroides bouchesdurhonensis]RHJ94010.1 tRNA epoxyqueuosine(34) reductase QueG [Bacteroides sp. AM07-16]